MADYNLKLGALRLYFDNPLRKEFLPAAWYYIFVQCRLSNNGCVERSILC
jgi:hypothetical protein